MERIRYSVGQGGRNLPPDVAVVQILLNRHRPSGKPLLTIDKIAGNATIDAIKEFQTSVVKLPKADGRIDPNGKTVEYLYTSPTWVNIQSTVQYLNGLVATIEARIKSATSGLGGLIPVNLYSQQRQIAWGAKVSPAFKSKVIEISKRLDINPDYLMACMAFETGETFSPKEPNKAGSGAVGLIQFLPPAASDLGTDLKKLSAMTDIEQLDYVEKWMKLQKIRQKKPLSTLEDMYMAILWPAAIGMAANSPLFTKGMIEYTQNSGFDLNKDGNISPGEISSTVRKKYEKGLKQGYIG